MRTTNAAKIITVNVEYDMGILTSIDKDREIEQAIGKECDSSGAFVFGEPRVRDMQFEYRGKVEARAAMNRLRRVRGIRVRMSE